MYFALLASHYFQNRTILYIFFISLFSFNRWSTKKWTSAALREGGGGGGRASAPIVPPFFLRA